MVALGLLGSWLVRIGLRPLTAVERAAGEITDSELDRRVPGDDRAPRSVASPTAINHMLDRLHGAFDQREDGSRGTAGVGGRMRQFVADASHELRTPIAATARTPSCSNAGRTDRPDDLERAMAGIRSETARMAELVDDLLLLAQLDEGRPIDRARVDLAAIAFDAVRRGADGGTRSSGPPSYRRRRGVTGDAARLRQVIDNLLANVRTHTPPGTTCTLIVSRDHDEAVISVADDGPGCRRVDAAPSVRSLPPRRHVPSPSVGWRRARACRSWPRSWPPTAGPWRWWRHRAAA